MNSPYSSGSMDVRLGNRSSDESLILDEGNTGVAWVDTESEPATFQLNQNIGFSSSQSNRVADIGAQWFKEPWIAGIAHEPKTVAALEGSPSVYNLSMQPRLSLHSEESEVPLLSSETWTTENYVEGLRHCHHQSSLPANNSAWRRLMSATVLCLFFMIAEFLGAVFSDSIAIMTDAAHLLSDLVGLLVSLLAVWLGQRYPTRTLSFGFHRAEVLGALFSIFIIWVMTGVFVYIAIMRLVKGNISIIVDRMMAVAAGGIVINIIMGVVLHGGCQQLNVPHSHGLGIQGHSHGISEGRNDNSSQYPSCARRSNNHGSSGNDEHSPEGGPMNKRANINVRAAAIHVLGDLIQSIGVFIAAVVIKFKPEAKIVDPICAFLFAILVVCTTLPLLRDTCLILLEGFPQSVDYGHVFTVLKDISGVQHVHSLHVWSLTAGKHALSVHLAVDADVDRDDVTFRAQNLLQTKFGIHICTIQTEIFDQAVMNSCSHCKPLVR